MNKQTGSSGPPPRRAPRSAILALIPAVLSLGLAACGGGKDDTASRQAAATQAAPAPPGQQAMPAAQQPPAGGAQSILAGVAFTPPADWQDLGPTNMRQAQYRLAPVGGDTAQGEVNVFYFGPESGGGVDANLQRWIGQMVMPDGSDPAASAKHSTFTADGMPGHIISLDGTYKSGGGPMMGGNTTQLPGYRLVGVVLEGPQGSLFFKLTGPAATARVMEAQLLTMMRAARKAA